MKFGGELVVNNALTNTMSFAPVGVQDGPVAGFAAVDV